jgi:hypothetical protein
MRGALRESAPLSGNRLNSRIRVVFVMFWILPYNAPHDDR